MSEDLKRLGLNSKKVDDTIHVWDDWRRIYLTMPDVASIVNGCVDAEHFWLRYYNWLIGGRR